MGSRQKLCYGVLNTGEHTGKQEPLMPCTRTSLAAFAVLLCSSLPACNMNRLTSLTVTPGPGAEVLSATGQTIQYKAIATYQSGQSSPVSSDVTDSVTWSASNPAVAAMSATGVATATGYGKTTITAEISGTLATSDVTVTASTTGSTAQPTLTILPAAGTSISPNVGETTQFLAIGDLSGSGELHDLTDNVYWQSSDVSVATINQSGLATTAGTAATTTTITAIATAANGSVLTASSTLTLAAQGSPVALPNLTIYEVGTDAAQGSISANPNLLTCSSQQSCSGFFQSGTTVTLSVAAQNLPFFGGWSKNCTGVGTPKQYATNGPLVTQSCSIILTNNQSVGAIFNAPAS